MHVSPPLFKKFLQKRLPPSQKQFLSYIYQSAKLFDQRVTINLDIRRNFHDNDQFNQPTRPPDVSPSKQLFKSSIDTFLVQPSFHRKSNHVGIMDASVCSHCNSRDCTDPITCSQYQLFQQFVNPISLIIFALTQIPITPLLLGKCFLFDVGFNCMTMILMQLILMIYFLMNAPNKIGVTLQYQLNKKWGLWVSLFRFLFPLLLIQSFSHYYS